MQRLLYPFLLPIQRVISETPDALRWVLHSLLLPSVGGAYFQAAGNAKKALMLT
jgi:hypothetical protein